MATRKKKSQKTPRRKRPQNNQVKVLLGILFLSAFLVLSLVFLSQLRENFRPKPSRTVAEVLSPSTVEDVKVELESTFLRDGILPAPTAIKDAKPGARIEIPAEFPQKENLDVLAQRLTRISGLIRMDSRESEKRLVILWKDRVLFSFLFIPPAHPPIQPPPQKSGAEVAIIVDDMGMDLHAAQTLLGFDIDLTFAILPWSQQAPQVDRLFHDAGREILIHLPMEPQSYPATNPGPHALFTDLTPEEIRIRFKGYRDRVPHATGGNNHMGSRFTENDEGMAVVLDEMKKAHLFFVDSLTTGKSVAYAEARKLQVPTAERDMFLDNIQESERILAEIRKLASLAKRQGYAVGICHPHKETIKALALAGELLKQQGVTVVPVSALLDRPKR